MPVGAIPVSVLTPRTLSSKSISIAEPPISAVILSHDHYDHLDHASILALAAKTEHFITPLSVGARLIGWGIDSARVQQFD